MRAKVEYAALVLICLLLALFAINATADDVPQDPTNAHIWADGVALPALQAALNAFYGLHPQDETRAFDHVRTLNAKDWAKDVLRGRAAREAAENYAKAMKRAGY